MFRRRRVIRGEHRLGQLVIDKVAGQLATSFPINQIAKQVLEALAHTPGGWAELRARLASARTQAETSGAKSTCRRCLPWKKSAAMPGSASPRRHRLEEIAVRARERLLELVYSRLSEVAESAIT